MGVYFDVLYKTFLFVPITWPIEFSGVVTSPSGQQVAGQEVIVTANKRKYRTFTNSKGEYKVPEKMTGPIQIRVGDVNKRVSRPGARVDIEIR
jgi:hypothetical protein